jgi:hypothetical protein
MRSKTSFLRRSVACNRVRRLRNRRRPNPIIGRVCCCNPSRSTCDRHLQLNMPYWSDYWASLQQFNLRRWNDGDSIKVNYIGHPMEERSPGISRCRTIRADASCRFRATEGTGTADFVRSCGRRFIRRNGRLGRLERQRSSINAVSLTRLDASTTTSDAKRRRSIPRIRVGGLYRHTDRGYVVDARGKHARPLCVEPVSAGASACVWD